MDIHADPGDGSDALARVSFFVAPHLSSPALVAVAATCSTLRDALHAHAVDAGVWAPCARRDWGIVAPSPPAAVLPCPWRAAWNAGAARASRTFPFAGRAVRAVARLAAAVSAAGAPDVAATLRPPAAPADVAAAEVSLRVAFPPALAALYLAADGQDPHAGAPLPGVFGAALVYDDAWSVTWLPLSGRISVVSATEFLRRRGRLHPRFVVITATLQAPRGPGCFTVVDTATGGVYAVAAAVLLPATPSTAALPPPAAAGAAATGEPPRGPVYAASHAAGAPLEWVEEFCRRVESGLYGCDPLPDDFAPDDAGAEAEAEAGPAVAAAPAPLQRISLHSRHGGAVASATTDGIAVTVSPLLIVAELARGDAPADAAPRGSLATGTGTPLPAAEAAATRPPVGAATADHLRWAYRVTLAMARGSPHAEAGAQLTHRHWVITDAVGAAAGEPPEEVRGPGVIGLTPHLRPPPLPPLPPRPARDFSYVSQVTMRSTRGGAMRGEFAFVPGGADAQAGPPFDVAVPEFALAVPPWLWGGMG